MLTLEVMKQCLKITEERKRVENENVLVEHLEKVNYDSVSSFNAEITSRNQDEDLDDSTETNEDNKHNKFRENLPRKNPMIFHITECLMIT